MSVSWLGWRGKRGEVGAMYWLVGVQDSLEAFPSLKRRMICILRALDCVTINQIFLSLVRWCNAVS